MRHAIGPGNTHAHTYARCRRRFTPRVLRSTTTAEGDAGTKSGASRRVPSGYDAFYLSEREKESKIYIYITLAY